MTKQKIVLVCALGLFILAGLCPPWVSTYDVINRPAGDSFYEFILASPEQAKIDVPRLLIEWVCIAAAGAVGWVLTTSVTRDRKGAAGKTREAEAPLPNTTASTPPLQAGGKLMPSKDKGDILTGVSILLIAFIVLTLLLWLTKR
jgi:hypothetical protein